MVKVVRQADGIKIFGLRKTHEIEAIDSEAHAIMLGIAEVYGFAPKIIGLMILARYSHGKFALVAEHDELYFCPDDEDNPTPEKLALLAEYGWRWDDGWSCFT